MKKLLTILLVLTMLFALTACGGGSPAETTGVPETTVPVATDETTAATEQTEPTVSDEEGFCFTFNGVVLTPGTVYDAAVMPEPSYTYEVPSCAFEGTDNVYSFDTIEITAFNDGTQEIIYAIAIFDPNLCTNEGLYLGDDAARVMELYGEDYEENGTAMVFTKANTMLTVILQDGFVVDMEFSWIAE